MTQYLMGIDIGSYESKGVLTDTSGAVVAQVALKHELEFLGNGQVEHDAEKVWWGETVTLCKRLLAQSGVAADAVAGVGLSGVFSMLPVDRAGKPVRRGAIMYGVDTRSTAEVAELVERFGADTILARTGNGLSVQNMGPKILWLKRHEPEVFEAAHSFLPCAGAIAARLTGAFNIDHMSAGFYGPLYDPATGDWAADLCEGIVPLDKLPAVKWASEIGGRVTAEAAAATGLAEGTPVTVGTSDVAAEALSIGVTRPGDMMLMYGSTAWITLITPEPYRHERLWSSPYLFPGTYSLHGGMATSGALTRWVRDVIASDLVRGEADGGEDAYGVLTTLADNVPPGSDGIVMLPYFSGERTPIDDPHARGVIFGLNITHGRAHLFRAALEGVGYSINHALEVMSEAGGKAELVSVVGGGTKSPVWLQSVSDITGVAQQVPKVVLGASYGDAFLAGFATGLIEDPAGIGAWVEMERRITPNPDNAAVYQARMRVYRELYERNRDLMHALAGEAGTA
ncbi:FGGY family carbohydrate kinase [Nitratireductor sp. StC3]|uniref:FGGY-family carbohydrate kinase n=1 Tax=Nitratireductor sp. StC3 TaxID=2126741 RepID=UPI000D0DB5D2|nr:FGGY family carbohydrate kinase [Nitratireductor sp. StC3]PSM16794.1 hypothetical protein C7T96_19175 [Nitratireductor sp. StC3]